MSDNGLMATILLSIFMIFFVALVTTRDEGAWESCRAKHSKQVCINILQEVGDE